MGEAFTVVTQYFKQAKFNFVNDSILNAPHSFKFTLSLAHPGRIILIIEVETQRLYVS